MYFVDAFLDELSKLAAERTGFSGAKVETNPVLAQMNLQKKLKAVKPPEPSANLGPPSGTPNPFLAKFRK